MKILSTALAISLLALCLHAESMQLKKTDGTTLTGTVVELFLGTVRMTTSDDTVVTVELADLDAASSASVLAWAARNPHAHDVYTSFDENPSPARTNNPRRFLSAADRNESGIVVVNIVTSATGEVLVVEIQRSNNPKLNDAAVQSMMDWRFNPAKVGGQPVKARFRLPVQF